MGDVKFRRRTLEVPRKTLEFYISQRFKVPYIASAMGVSQSTIKNRMKLFGLSIKESFSDISDENLHEMMASIILEKPNIGMKIMKGILINRGIRISEERLRQAMRTVDPVGVENRRKSNRTASRRTYNVPYSSALWHLDTNMKLNRYRMILKSCMDGKSRLCVCLDVANNNTAVSNLKTFMEAVRFYGCPERVRSDKGGENILIARFMLTARGIDNGSHITGRSVHNQRIERFWGDVNRITEPYYNMFYKLEDDGLLNIDDENHMFVLHYVFLPRIQISLKEYQQGWNNHALSTEHNMTPIQLFTEHIHKDRPTTLDKDLLENIYLDCMHVHNPDYEETFDPIRHRATVNHQLTSAIVDQIHAIDPAGPSNDNGRDIFQNCMALIRV